MKRIRAGRPEIRSERSWPQDLPVDPRDPDVVRAKALAHAWPTSSSRTNRAHLADTMHPGQIGTARTRA